MECIVLPSFDDGSIECRTFCIVEGEYEEPIVCEYDYILKHHADKLTQILEAMKQGKSYIGYLKDIAGTDKAMNFGRTERYCEIQWDQTY